MAAFAKVKKFKPTSPGVRHRAVISHALPKRKRDAIRKRLSKAKQWRAHRGGGSGRNTTGQITVRHRGGGAKRLPRIVDFVRYKDGIPARVAAIEYDPNRNAYIALVSYLDGEWSYIIAPKGLEENQMISNGSNAPIKVGNCLPMQCIPVGTVISCIEMKVGKGAQLIRSAGTSAMLAGIDGEYAIVRLKSGEIRKIRSECRAMIGEVSNSMHSLRRLGKAGASRHAGKRPTVRGTALNPVDHPHGGGEGRSFGRHPVSPTGVPTKGMRTRHTKRNTDLIIRRRRNKRRR